jgi:hypothetical protein
MKRKALNTQPTETQLIGQLVEAALMFGVVLERSNVAAFTNPNGQMVRCGVKGDPDLRGALRSTGRALRVEVKRPGFDPAKLRGKDRAHFLNQIERMEELNARGEVAFWVSSVDEFLVAMRILQDDPNAEFLFKTGLDVLIRHKDKP